MKKIRIMMDYQCYPMWVYNESGELICNDLISDLKHMAEIGELLQDIQISYNNLFINDETQFEYKGFDNEEAKSNFLSKVSKVMQLIQLKIGDRYIVENKVIV